MAEARELDAFGRLSDEIFGSEKVKLRRFVYNELPPDPDNATDADWEKAQQVSYSFDKLAYLVHYKLLSEERAVSLCYTIVVRMWDKLAPYARRGRINRGEDIETGRHSKYFEEFAALAYKHWQAANTGTTPRNPQYFKMTTKS